MCCLPVLHNFMLNTRVWIRCNPHFTRKKSEINQIISSADSGFELKSDTRAQDFLIQWFSTLDSYQTNGNLKSKNLRLGATISTVLRSRPLTTTKSSAVTTLSSVELSHKHSCRIKQDGFVKCGKWYSQAIKCCQLLASFTSQCTWIYLAWQFQKAEFERCCILTHSF